MTEELENIYAAMAEAAGRGDVRGAVEYVDGMPEKDKIELMAHATQLVRVHTLLREELIVHADRSSPYADRRAMGRACEVPASTIYRWLDKRDRPRDRRAQG